MSQSKNNVIPMTGRTVLGPQWMKEAPLELPNEPEFCLELDGTLVALIRRAGANDAGCHYMPYKKEFDRLAKFGWIALRRMPNPAYYPNAVLTDAGRSLLEVINNSLKVRA